MFGFDSLVKILGSDNNEDMSNIKDKMKKIKKDSNQNILFLFGNAKIDSISGVVFDDKPNYKINSTKNSIQSYI